MSLRLVDPGLCSLVVDRGRPGSRSLGMPVGGAADRSALAIGNAMLGNPADAAGLEMALVGPTLVALDRTGAVVVGAPFRLSSGRQTLVINRSFTLEAEEELHVGGSPHGARAYLCVVGGFQNPVVLGSRSSWNPLPAGAELPCDASSVRKRLVRPELPLAVVPSLSRELPAERQRLRVVAGPQVDWFPPRPDGSPFALDSAQDYIVSPTSNRMGLRLNGPALPVPPREMVSEAVCPGSIQVTRDGQPIVLGVDGQTIGGYPKVAQVISADLDLLGQLRPGDRVVFQTVSLDVAQHEYRSRERHLQRLCAGMRLAAQAF